MSENTIIDPNDPDGDSELLNALARNPAELGFPPMLAMDLALKLDKPHKICAIYGITKEDFAKIIAHPVFIKSYQEAVEMLKTDGMAFRIKARLQAEGYLTTVFQMVQNGRTSDAVRADLIKSTVRWAGLDAKATDVNAGTGFNIQINLGPVGP
jgi:hypothetical protein